MEEPKKESTEAVKPQISILEQAEAIAKRIEESNKKAEEILAKNEQQLSRIMLSGRSNAGYETPAKREETPKEYKDRIMRGLNEGK